MESMPTHNNDDALQSEYGNAPTMLSGYSSLEKLLKERFSQTCSKEISTALLFVGLDDLSRFNDDFGFNIDDKLMIKISQDISLFLGSRDILAKVGNHQFVIVQDLSSPESAEVLAKHIIHTLSEPCIVDAHMFYIHASIGISLYAVDGDSAHKLIMAAKDTMKNIQVDSKTHIGFSKDRTTMAPCERRLNIMADLPAAIENGEIYFLYQPQYSHAEKRFTGAELLARWEHPEYGDISPGIFIPVAEKSGMIGPLTTKAIITALKLFSLFEANGMDDFSLSVNISPLFLMSSSFEETIDFLIEQYDPHGGKLHFEITEEILLKNTDNLIKTLEKIKAHNIGIELDDFGTGYTSLHHLAYLPIDTLKIDRSFVSDIDKDLKKRALFRAIADMSHALDINIIAEGVENSLEDITIKTFNPIIVQGYFYSKPIRLDSMIEIVNSS